MTSIDDALDVYFDPAVMHLFNNQFNRQESSNATHGLFWFWLDQPKKVIMVITCFTI